MLANAGCYADEVGSNYSTLTPDAADPGLHAAPRRADWKKQIPEEYLAAFEAAAGRYELGKRGVWTLAAIARLESNFGRGMSKKQLRTEGAARARPDGVEPLRGRRRQGRPPPPRRHRRLGGDAGAADVVARRHRRRRLHPQPGRLVRRRGRRTRPTQLAGKCAVTSKAWTIVLPGDVASQINWQNLTLSNDLELRDIQAGMLDQRVTGLLALMTKDHQITITALRSDHSQMTASGNVSNHFYGRAMDIASVDGVSCTDTSTTAPCAELGYALAQLPAPLHPTELIYCFDLDGPGPAFALPDHCDHIHAGYYAY